MTEQVISHYHILEKLSGGGNGFYKAQDSRLQDFVALNCLPDEMAQDPAALK